MIRLTSESPRNSSRSLCGAPALRWVRACASRPGSRNGWPISVKPASVQPAAAAQLLLGVELADDVQVVDQRLADFVLDRHQIARVAALDLQVVALHVVGIADGQLAEEEIAGARP